MLRIITISFFSLFSVICAVAQPYPTPRLNEWSSLQREKEKSSSNTTYDQETAEAISSIYFFGKSLGLWGKENSYKKTVCIEGDCDNGFGVKDVAEIGVVQKGYWKDGCLIKGSKYKYSAQSKDSLLLVSMGNYTYKSFTKASYIDYCNEVLIGYAYFSKWSKFYIGEMGDGNRNGFGQMYSADSLLLEEGTYSEGWRAGEFTQYHKNGEISFDGIYSPHLYSKVIVESWRKGRGTSYYDNNQILYSGEWNVIPVSYNPPANPADLFDDNYNGKPEIVHIFDSLGSTTFKGMVNNSGLNGKGIFYLDQGIFDIKWIDLKGPITHCQVIGTFQKKGANKVKKISYKLNTNDFTGYKNKVKEDRIVPYETLLKLSYPQECQQICIAK